MNEETKNILKKIIHKNNKMQGGLGGQAFTSFICIGCLNDISHPNTCTPMICRDCVSKARDDIKKDSR